MKPKCLILSLLFLIWQTKCDNLNFQKKAKRIYQDEDSFLKATNKILNKIRNEKNKDDNIIIPVTKKNKRKLLDSEENDSNKVENTLVNDINVNQVDQNPLDTESKENEFQNIPTDVRSPINKDNKSDVSDIPDSFFHAEDDQLDNSKIQNDDDSLPAIDSTVSAVDLSNNSQLDHSKIQNDDDSLPAIDSTVSTVDLSNNSQNEFTNISQSETEVQIDNDIDKQLDNNSKPEDASNELVGVHDLMETVNKDDDISSNSQKIGVREPIEGNSIETNSLPHISQSTDNSKSLKIELSHENSENNVEVETIDLTNKKNDQDEDNSIEENLQSRLDDIQNGNEVDISKDNIQTKFDDSENGNEFDIPEDNVQTTLDDSENGNEFDIPEDQIELNNELEHPSQINQDVPSNLSDLSHVSQTSNHSIGSSSLKSFKEPSQIIEDDLNESISFNSLNDHSSLNNELEHHDFDFEKKTESFNIDHDEDNLENKTNNQESSDSQNQINVHVKIDMSDSQNSKEPLKPQIITLEPNQPVVSPVMVDPLNPYLGVPGIIQQQSGYSITQTGVAQTQDEKPHVINVSNVTSSNGSHTHKEESKKVRRLLIV